LSQPVGTACTRHIGMASADYQEVIFIDSEDEDFYFSDVFKENMEISYEDYIKKGLEWIKKLNVL
jgi:hypothetical protein